MFSDEAVGDSTILCRRISQTTIQDGSISVGNDSKSLEKASKKALFDNA
jgi:hypothetical protein